MPPKRRTRRDGRSGSESDTDTDVDANATVVGASSSPTVTMSEQMLQTLISNITRSQVEANRLLVESILSGNQHFATPSPRLDTPSHQQRAGNFAKCTARFDGRSKDADQLEAFIDAIEVYRECTNVSEEHALRGLPMLLVGDAAVWWQGVKSTVSSWSDALHRLRGMYGVPRPAYKIFRDVFSLEQGHERADVFVSKVRAMLSKVPYVVPEEMKLDIVYGLLERRIRKRVPRDAVDGLEGLMIKAAYHLCDNSNSVKTHDLLTTAYKKVFVWS